jgi:transposase
VCSPRGVNVLSEDKRQQVLALGRLRWPLRRIQEATGVRRETASLYLKAAGIAVRAPGQRSDLNPASGVSPDPAVRGANPASEASTDSGTPTANPASEVSTDSVLPPWPPARYRAPAASACEPYRELITAALAKGRDAKAIWHDLVDDHGFTHKYASVKRFVARLRETPTVEARPVIATAPGEEAQVDYGEGPMVRHPTSGKYRRTRLFVLTLGYSRKSVRLLTWQSSTQIWSELHERAFRRLGGAPRVVVLDNLKEGVLKADVHDPSLNPLYRDVLDHYGVVALPCRVRDPNRKGKVESGVGHAQRTPLKGLRFEALDEAQAYLDRWEERWADTRIHGTTKRQVAAMFAEERVALLPLPIEPFRYYKYGQRVVHLDGFVEVDAAYYAPPPGWIGREVHVQWDASRVRILDPKTGQLLREHYRLGRGRHVIRDEDRPTSTPAGTLKLLARAAACGPNVGTLCETLQQREGQLAVRRILGVLALAKKHSPGAVDKACAEALELGLPTYRFVRRYLERFPPPPLSLRQVDPIIRELTQYRDLIERRTGASE